MLKEYLPMLKEYLPKLKEYLPYDEGTLFQLCFQQLGVKCGRALSASYNSRDSNKNAMLD